MGLIIRLIVSIFYFGAGLSAFLAYVVLKNYPSSILAAITAMLSAILTHIHFLKYKNKLEEWYTAAHLAKIGIFGFAWFALSFANMVYLVAVEIMLKTPMLPIAGSVVLPIVWSFMACKTGIYLWLFATSYADHHGETRLIEEPEALEA